MEILAERIRTLRENAGLTRLQLAKEIGVTERTLQRYEHAEREPGASALMSLAQVLHVSIDYLVGLTDRP